MWKKHRQPLLPLIFLVFSSLGIFSSKMVLSIRDTNKIPINIGVVLDMNISAGKIGWTSISMALSDFYASHAHYKTRLILHPRDSHQDVVGAAAAVIDLLKSVQVQAIIGPMTSEQASFVISLGETAQVPIISFSATAPSFLALQKPYFIGASPNDAFQVQAIVSLIQGFKWKAVVPICEGNLYVQGVVPSLTNALLKVGAHVPYTSIIHPSASDKEIISELSQLMLMHSRVFVVHLSPSLAARLFVKVREAGMMAEGYVWIVTDGVINALNTFHHSVIDSMQGVLGVKPYVPRTRQLENFHIRWKRKFQEENSRSELTPEFNVYGVWAYDAATALAIAVEKIEGEAKTKFIGNKNVSGNPWEVLSFSVSSIGKDLWKELANFRFHGLVGVSHIMNGQLQATAFEVVNVIGKGDRTIGIWSPKTGFAKKLNATNLQSYNPSVTSNLESIIWPGITTNTPKIQGILENNKKLKIGVPVKYAPSKFVNVSWDPITDEAIVTGYSIDIFDAAMAKLPNNVSYEYIPFAKADHTSNGSYDDLVYQVHLGNYDAAVGDITITSNRSRFADFTPAYSEPGLTLVVPVKDKTHKNAWVFLKPLTWDLWVTSACFFIFIGFIIWILEHKKNEDFIGTVPHQVGTSLWFSFSTMVFAHKEKVISNLARFVVIIWCFVVLILTQSYTASLTTMLTVQHLEPTIQNLQELVEKGVPVGYPKGSFVQRLLPKLQIDSSRLRQYDSMDQLDVALSNGSIAAAFDEKPYMKIFCAKHCPKYTIVETTHRTAGFGFAFRKGSPLLPNISRALLNVTEDNTMSEIMKQWFGETSYCSDSVSASSLNTSSFWGLFILVGVASFLALIILSALLIYENRNWLMQLDIQYLLGQLAQLFNPRGQTTNDSTAPAIQPESPSGFIIWRPASSNTSFEGVAQFHQPQAASI